MAEATITITETTENKERTTKANELNNALAHFIGSMQQHRFSPLSRLVLTDGVQYLAEKAGAYWLMDIIASYQQKCMKDEMLRDFQIWTLKVTDGTRSGHLRKGHERRSDQTKIPIYRFSPRRNQTLLYKWRYPSAKRILIWLTLP